MGFFLGGGGGGGGGVFNTTVRISSIGFEVTKHKMTAIEQNAILCAVAMPTRFPLGHDRILICLAKFSSE